MTDLNSDQPTSGPPPTEQALRDLVARMRVRGDDDALLVASLVDELTACRGQARGESHLHENQATLMRLARSQALGEGQLDAALAEITETAAKILESGRASVWRYTRDRQAITCLDLYRLDERMHESGIELDAIDYPRYFASLLEQKPIAAHDAHTDPRTAEFSELYLSPLGISSMLDTPIRVGGEVVGVLCIEHTGPTRRWTESEQQFGSALADFVALAIESSDRRKIEHELRELVDLAEQRLETIERQRLAIADLSAPLIDVWDGILALPVVGLVDTQRSIELTERLLNRIADSGTRSVIVDLTGVDLVDTMTANHLLQMIRAASLLGTFSVLSGISPAVAQTLVQLDVDLSEITTVRNLKEALKVCLRRTMVGREAAPPR
jgi:rsbT co-antagonist protein RsbR